MLRCRMPIHRPFWVVRHRITGQTKQVGYGSEEDGMWQVVLTDGSVEASVQHEQPAGKGKNAGSQGRKHP